MYKPFMKMYYVYHCTDILIYRILFEPLNVKNISKTDISVNESKNFELGDFRCVI